MIDLALKQVIINEYLVGGISQRRLSKKYGISHQSIYRWVNEYEQGQTNTASAAAQAAILQAMNEQAKQAGQPEMISPAAQIQELQKQLAEERLHNKLLTAIIDVAEEELKIPIRKKYGTRQFKK